MQGQQPVETVSLLKQARRDAKLTAADVASKLRITEGHLLHLESGIRKTSDINIWFGFKNLYGWDVKEMLRIMNLTRGEK